MSTSSKSLSETNSVSCAIKKDRQEKTPLEKSQVLNNKKKIIVEKKNCLNDPHCQRKVQGDADFCNGCAYLDGYRCSHEMF